MNIYDVLKEVPFHKRQYFTWKHDIRFDRSIPKKSEEELLKEINRKTLNGLIRWEKTAEYRGLVLLLIESRIANDMEEIYEVTSKKAREGDERAIKLLLDLHKKAQENAKLMFKQVKEESHYNDDDLDVS